MSDTYDLIVIGAGPAGQSAAEVAAFFGHTAIVVERARPGGVVATTGGAPTKTLRDAAVFLTGFRQEEVYGITTGVPLEVARPIIRTRTFDACRSLQDLVGRQIAARGIAYLAGTARIGPDRTVAVVTADGGQRTLVGRAILVATGSRPAHVAAVPFDDPDVYDSDQIYSLRRVPANVTIVGGGPVGVEFATVFTALGIPVTLVDHGERLLPAMDGELVALLTADLRQRGVTTIFGAGAAAVARIDGALRMTLTNGSVLDSDAVLFAAGRTPNTANLGLEDAGVALDARGRIVVDRYFRTSADGVYAAGDVLGPTLASISMQQGRAAACHALGLVFATAVDRASSSAVYGLPEIAGVGLTEEQVRESRVPYVAGRCDLAETARGIIAGHGGRLKLIVRAEDRKLLGIHCIGDIASELVGLGHVALHLGAAVDVFLTLALNTPTFSYAYRDAAIDSLARLAELAGSRVAHTLQGART